MDEVRFRAGQRSIFNTGTGSIAILDLAPLQAKTEALEPESQRPGAARSRAHRHSDRSFRHMMMHAIRSSQINRPGHRCAIGPARPSQHDTLLGLAAPDGERVAPAVVELYVRKLVDAYLLTCLVRCAPSRSYRTSLRFASQASGQPCDGGCGCG